MDAGGIERAFERSFYGWLRSHSILHKGVLAGTVLGTAALTARMVGNALGNHR